MAMSNPLLQQAETQMETGLSPDTAAAYEKIVVAGMHAALGPGPNGESILSSLRNSPDPIADAAKGAVSLVLILRKEAKGIMPLKAMVPAAMTLMLKALDFADRSGIAQVGNNELVRATHIFTDFLFARLGITKQGLQNAANRVNGIINDPTKMAAIHAKMAGGTPPAGAPTASAPPPAAATPAPSGMINQ